MERFPACSSTQNLGHCAGEDQRLYPQRMQGIIEIGAVESAIAVFINDVIAGLRVNFVNYISTVEGAVHIRIVPLMAALAR
jgi:hypothetical protein